MYRRTIQGLLHRRPGAIAIDFSFSQIAAKKTLSIEMILDFDVSRDVIGIEILNLKYHAGAEVLNGFNFPLAGEAEEMTFTYSEESDAFYLSLSNERSLDQCAVNGDLVLDSDDHLVGIRIDVI